MQYEEEIEESILNAKADDEAEEIELKEETNRRGVMDGYDTFLFGNIKLSVGKPQIYDYL